MPGRLFTDAQLARATGATSQRAAHWGGVMRMAMTRQGIDTPRRMAHFFAQLGHESASLTRTTENLNYSAIRLRQVFPRYFSVDQAAQYAGQPQRIANRVYANRMGNRDEASGDGWRYRGRGLLQITGANNYRRMGELLDMPLLLQPDLLLQPSIGAEASAAWWRVNGLNPWADRNDALAISRAINLGSATHRSMPNGWQDRAARTQRALSVFGG